MASLNDYQTANLMVLMGANPLPNYVAARLLLKPNLPIGQSPYLYVLHTKETGPLATRLSEVLGQEGLHINVTPVPVDGTSARDIHDKVQRYAADHTSIGLNYTGGTKFMAVHAHAALRQKHKASIGSYLDARSLTMRFDRGQDYLPAVDIDLALEVPLQTLLKLHGYSLSETDRPTSVPRYPELACALAQVPVKDLRAWCDNNLRSGQDTPFRKDSDLRDGVLPTDAPFSDFIHHWAGEATLGELATKLDTKVGKLACYLDGDWLEHYTLWALQQIADGCHLHDATQNIVPRERKFQLDVVAMRGYQLFALSCSTDAGKGRLKQKLFEAYVRARQLGGDEARVALVCGASTSSRDGSPVEIQREIAEAWDAEGKICVFGAEHIPKLPERLANWIRTASRVEGGV